MKNLFFVTFMFLGSIVMADSGTCNALDGKLDSPSGNGEYITLRQDSDCKKLELTRSPNLAEVFVFNLISDGNPHEGKISYLRRSGEKYGSTKNWYQVIDSAASKLEARKITINYTLSLGGKAYSNYRYVIEVDANGAPTHYTHQTQVINNWVSID